VTVERPARDHRAHAAPPAAKPASGPAAKPLRADARRNHDMLLAAGRAVFLRAGADAPMDDIAKEAGVGRGTLYRHFPTRDHLFVAILRDRVDLLERRAADVLDAPDPWAALTEWLALYDRSATEYSGMSARVGESLADDASPVAAACAPMKAGFALLLARAQRAGLVRADVTPLQVLSVVAALPKTVPADTAPGLYLDIVLRGLRTGA
jgi:AcrR family transcriptional regulator